MEAITNMHCSQQGTQLESLVWSLPSSLGLFLGTVIYPDDNGAKLAQHIAYDTALGATDGSLIQTSDSLYGGHAATIQQEHSDEQAFTILAPTPHSTNMSSTTTELFAFISAALLLVHLVSIAQSITCGFIIIYIDNQEAEKTGNNDLTLINISNYLSTDYDLSVIL